MGRRRQYGSDAERQKAYRERKAKEDQDVRERAAGIRGGAGVDVRTLQRLAAILGMFGSDYEGERQNAGFQAERLRKEMGKTWYELLGVPPPEKR